MAAIGFVLFMVGAIAMCLIGRKYPGNWIGVPVLTTVGGGVALMIASIAEVLWRVMP